MKIRNLSIILVIFSFWAIITSPVSAALTAEWGDVVNVRYSLYLDPDHTQPVAGNEDQELRYIYLAPGTNVNIPKHIQDLFPEQYNAVPRVLHSGYLDKFEEGIVGMQINQEKNVHILPADAYTDPSHQLYNQDLYFKITLLAILFDASTYSTSTSSSTNGSPSPSNPLQEFGAIILLGGSVTIIGGTLLLRNIQSSRRMEKTLSTDRTRTVMQQSTLQKEKNQLKELRELTESYSPSEDSSTEKSEIKFRRRR